MIYLCVDQKLEVRRTRLFCNFIKLYLQMNWHGNRLIVSLAILSTFYARPDNSTVRKVDEYINGMENEAHLPYALHSSILYVSSRRLHYFSIADVTVTITNIPYKCYLVIYDYQIYFLSDCFALLIHLEWVGLSWTLTSVLERTSCPMVLEVLVELPQTRSSSCMARPMDQEITSAASL